MTEPASVVGAGERRPPSRTSTSRPPIVPGRRPSRRAERASLTSSSRSAWLEPADERPERGVDVEAVGDQLDERVVLEERRDREARRTVVDAGHRVEQVGRRSGAGRVARPAPGARSPRSGRATRRRRAPRSQPIRSSAPGSSGRDRHDAEAVDQRLEVGGVDVGRAAQVRGVVGAALRSARNGPSRLNPSGSAPSPAPRAASRGRGRRTRPASSSGAVTAVGRNDVTPCRSSAAGHPVERRRVAHRVVAAPAVDVDVDEARARCTAARRRRRAVVERDRGDQPVLDHEPPPATRSSRTSRPRIVGSRHGT